MQIGIIADDLTGASDIAGFIAAEGLSVVQFAGLPRDGATAADGADCVVISLKSRSVPAEQAVSQSLAALARLRERGCRRFYFKYCSTFDSTPKGNIGPVTDALMDALGSDFTVICPTLPANGRTVRGGDLYVNGVLLENTGMRTHPLNPMSDSNLPRLMEAQAKGKAGVVDLATVERGADAVRERLAGLRAAGIRYAVTDSETDGQLDTLAEALDDAVFLTGGSSLGAALARRIRAGGAVPAGDAAGGRFGGGRAVVLSGSCSAMTNAQTAFYRERAPWFRVDIGRCLADAPAHAAEAAAWADAAPAGAESPAPMVSATVAPEELSAIQARFGADAAAQAVERFFSLLAARLRDAGFDAFIIAGGETSGAVSAALGVSAFRIGTQIAPGVSWVFDAGAALALAMKSGNFGDEAFFIKAQEIMRRESAHDGK